jgi:hypothetical protein
MEQLAPLWDGDGVDVNTIGPSLAVDASTDRLLLGIEDAYRAPLEEIRHPQAKAIGNTLLDASLAAGKRDFVAMDKLLQLAGQLIDALASHSQYEQEVMDV